jgi:hypothetical protein
VWLGGLGKLKKSTSLGTRTGDLPACGIVPQPITLLRAPINYILYRQISTDDGMIVNEMKTRNKFRVAGLRILI